ncbi:hypothetical protein ACTXT7_006783 [Hymenolepis weldensis]
MKDLYLCPEQFTDKRRNLSGPLLRMITRSIISRAQSFRLFSSKAFDFQGAYNLSGSLRDRPKIDRYGTWKSLSIAVPFIILGGYISMKGAAYLEEHDIFVPEDDD